MCSYRFQPHFTTKLKDTTVKDGEGLTLECEIEGNPRPQISWIRDGVEIFDSQVCVLYFFLSSVQIFLPVLWDDAHIG